MTPKDIFCLFGADKMMREALDEMRKAMKEGKTKGECVEILKTAYEKAMTFLRCSEEREE